MSELVPFNSSFGDTATVREDDGGSGEIKLMVPFPFFGRHYNQVYVNNNGIITFNKNLSDYRPGSFPLKTTTALIAPFWADVDVKTTGGTIWYRQTMDKTILAKAQKEIRKLLPAYRTFRAYWAFVVTWENVGFFGAEGVGVNKRNTFQVVLILDYKGDLAFLVMNYSRLDWTTGSNSQGSTTSGLGGRAAQAGFNVGNKKDFIELEGARTPAVINLTLTSNVGVPGKWLFRVDSQSIFSPCEMNEMFLTPNYGSMLGGQLVSVSGPCIQPELPVTGLVEQTGTQFCCFNRDGDTKCVMPPMFNTGVFDVSLNVGNMMWNYTSKFEVKNVMDVRSGLLRLEPDSWHPGANVKFLVRNVSSLVKAPKYQLDFLEYERESYATPFQIKSSGALVTFTLRHGDLKDDFVMSVDMPADLSPSRLAVLRISSILDDCGSFGPGPSLYSDVFPVQPTSGYQAESLCADWLASARREVKPSNPSSGYCPCTLGQAEGDTGQYTRDPLCNKDSKWPLNCQYRSMVAGECIIPNETSSESKSYVCCYDKDTGELLNALDGRGGGTRESYSLRQSSASVFPYFTYMADDIVPYLQCCLYSSNDTLCNSFLDYRPPVDCQGYETPAAAQASGDPHIETLDGHRYTFNGMGEYVLLRVKESDAVIQIRMSQATDLHGYPQNATVFTSVALQASNDSSVVEIRSDSTEDNLFSVFVDKEPVELTSSTSKFKEITVYYPNYESGDDDGGEDSSTTLSTPTTTTTANVKDITPTATSQANDTTESSVITLNQTDEDDRHSTPIINSTSVNEPNLATSILVTVTTSETNNTQDYQTSILPSSSSLLYSTTLSESVQRSVSKSISPAHQLRGRTGTLPTETVTAASPHPHATSDFVVGASNLGSTYDENGTAHTATSSMPNDSSSILPNATDSSLSSRNTRVDQGGTSTNPQSLSVSNLTPSRSKRGASSFSRNARIRISSKHRKLRGSAFFKTRESFDSTTWFRTLPFTSPSTGQSTPASVRTSRTPITTPVNFISAPISSNHRSWKTSSIRQQNPTLFGEATNTKYPETTVAHSTSLGKAINARHPRNADQRSTLLSGEMSRRYPHNRRYRHANRHQLSMPRHGPDPLLHPRHAKSSPGYQHRKTNSHLNTVVPKESDGAQAMSSVFSRKAQVASGRGGSLVFSSEINPQHKGRKHASPTHNPNPRLPIIPSRANGLVIKRTSEGSGNTLGVHSTSTKSDANRREINDESGKSNTERGEDLLNESKYKIDRSDEGVINGNNANNSKNSGSSNGDSSIPIRNSPSVTRSGRQKRSSDGNSADQSPEDSEHLPLTTSQQSDTKRKMSEVTVVIESLGLSILIQVMPDVMNIMTVAAPHLKGRLEGLLGNYNGDSQDDLVNSYGVMLSPSSSMRDVHNQFGGTWEVESASSLFAVDMLVRQTDVVGSVPVTTFTPVFIDEMDEPSVAEGEHNIGEEPSGAEVCGDNLQCRFDLRVTGRMDIAVSTLKFSERFEERKRELQPVVRCPHPPTIPNSNRSLTGQKAQDRAVYQCFEGFKFVNGSGMLTCLSSGQWDQSTPVCVKVLNKKSEFPILYVAIGAAVGGFVVVLLCLVAFVGLYRRVSRQKGSKKVESSSDYETVIELPTIFPISDIPSPVFENPSFMASLQKLSENGNFHIPRPTYVDPSIYSEYF